MTSCRPFFTRRRLPPQRNAARTLAGPISESVNDERSAFCIRIPFANQCSDYSLRCVHSIPSNICPGDTLWLQHVHRILDSKFSVFTFFNLVHNRSLRCGVWSSYWSILMVRTWNNTLINFFYFHIFLWKFFEFSIFLRASCTLWRLATARAVLKILISYKICFLIQWFLEKRILLNGPKSKQLNQIPLIQILKNLNQRITILGFQSSRRHLDTLRVAIKCLTKNSNSEFQSFLTLSISQQVAASNPLRRF